MLPFALYAMLTRLPILKPRVIRAMLKQFALGSTATFTAGDLGISRHTVNEWFNHWREAILEHSRLAPRFSGVVEIDQTQLTGRGSKRAKARQKQLDNSYAPNDTEWQKILRKRREQRAKELIKQGKHPWQPVKALGLLSRSGQVYTHIIENEKSDTLLPIVYMVVEEGSTIYTDSWRSYGRLKEDKYKHEVIDHSRSFTNAKGVHINHIESFWSFAKRHLNRFNGLNKRRAVLMLKECEFRWNTGGAESWKVLMKKIEALAPIPKKSQKRKKGFKPPFNPNSKKVP